MAKHNPNKLTYSYSLRDKDFLIKYPRKCDWSLIYNLFNDILRYDWEKEKRWLPAYYVFNLTKELEKRWYDTSTLKFSIELKNNL